MLLINLIQYPVNVNIFCIGRFEIIVDTCLWEWQVTVEKKKEMHGMLKKSLTPQCGN